MTLNTLIVDLDGTIANPSHRQYFLDREEPDWDAFFLASQYDDPFEDVIQIVNALHDSFIHVRIWTGRGDVSEKLTKAWLAINGVYYTELRMRKRGDVTPDDLLKSRWIKEYKLDPVTTIVFEDRQKVVDMWISCGFRVFQVAQNNF